MYIKILALIILTSLISCNDGDVFITELDFPETLQYCEGSSDLIIYSIKDSPYESLSIKLPLSELSNLTTVGEFTTALSNTYTFNYRTYSGNPDDIFCNSLPPSSPTILSDYEAISGDVKFNTTLEEDDNDGIPAALEDDNTDGDNDPSTNPTDTDGDGIPNYLDSDDDGDNVPTANENPDPNNDGDLTDALDTDTDGTPNYLDTDDDNDGVITRYEDTNSDNNPLNDITDALIGPDYLNNIIVVSVTNDLYRNHTINQTYNSNITIENAFLTNNESDETLTYENFYFGIITTFYNDVNYEVSFN